MRTNPFPTTAYIGPEYFCDRKEESDVLKSNILNGLSTTVIAIRRMGKTGLIHHVFASLPKSYLIVYLDILATNNKKEFLNNLSSAIINSVPEETTLGKKIWKFIRSLRPTISFEPLTGNLQVSIEGTSTEIDSSIHSILSFLEKLNKKVVIAIDEFQQILQYPETNMDSWLRTIMQSLTNVVFVFSGSQRHLMTQLFADPKRPFYRSTQILHFDRIPRNLYKEFIYHHFSDNKKRIDPEVINKILDWTKVHTYYVQLICNRLFANSDRVVKLIQFQQETGKLLKEQEIVFFQYRDLLTKPQWNLLKAIGLEEITDAPTSMGFIRKNNLGNPATVLRSLKALEEKEMIYHQLTENGKKNYQIYDVLLKRWIESKYKI